MVRVIIRDTRFNENNYLELTDDQYRLLDWIEGKEFMEDVEVEIAESYDFQKIYKKGVDNRNPLLYNKGKIKKGR